MRRHGTREIGRTAAQNGFRIACSARMSASKVPPRPRLPAAIESINVTLRKKLDLYVNFRPVRMLPGLKTRFQGTAHRHGHLPREHRGPLLRSRARSGHGRRRESEDHHPHRVHPHRARHLSSSPAARAAKKSCAVHKANIMKMSDGLFLKCCREIAAQFPGNQVRRADRRQRLHAARHAPGDLRRSAAAESLRRYRFRSGGRASGRPRHRARRESGRTRTQFSKPCTAPRPISRVRGRRTPRRSCNPPALLLAHLGERDAARRLQLAIEGVYAEGKHLTADLGGSASTTEFTSAVIARMR